MRLRTIAPFAAALVFCCACRRPKTEEVKKDQVTAVAESPEVPVPAELVLDMQIRDPEALFKAVSDGLRPVGDVSEQSLDKLIEQIGDPAAQHALKVLDSHGTLSLVVTMPKSGPAVTVAMAAVVKDPAAAREGLSAHAKAHREFTSVQSKVLGTPMYDDGQGTKLAIIDRVAIVANEFDALEACGRYLAFRSTRSKPAHQVMLHVPSTHLAPRLQHMATTEWDKLKPSRTPSRTTELLEQMVPKWIGALGELGDIDVQMDVVGSELRIEQRVPTRGALAAWTTSSPSGRAEALLALPRGDLSGVAWLPSGGGPLVGALLGDVLDSAVTLKGPEKAEILKHLTAFGGALGGEMGYTATQPRGAASSANATEFLYTLTLTDPAAAKTALVPLRKSLEKVVGKVSVAPLKQFGAEGETLTLSKPSAAGGVVMTWAVQGERAFFDVCFDCKPALVEPALDAASTGRWSSDEVAKAKMAELSKERVNGVVYGVRLPVASALFVSLGMPPAIGGSKPGYGWTTTAPDGTIAGKGVVTLAALADLAKLYPMLMMMGMGN